MAADRPADEQRADPALALDDPASQAWGARLIQVALERRRRRLERERDDAA